MKRRTHTHACVYADMGCTNRLSCDGQSDGFGACEETWMQDVACLDCEERRCPRCHAWLPVGESCGDCYGGQPVTEGDTADYRYQQSLEGKR